MGNVQKRKKGSAVTIPKNRPNNTPCRSSLNGFPPGIAKKNSAPQSTDITDEMMTLITIS